MEQQEGETPTVFTVPAVRPRGLEMSKRDVILLGCTAEVYHV